MIKVLVVDDAIFMRTVLKNMLDKNEYEVVAEASNGIEAIQAFKKHKPDIVTMDITMPEMDGISALKEIMQVDPKAKVCMVSAMGQEKIIFDCVKNGAKDFLVKPFNIEDVAKKMKRLSS
jgi:two-component system chemotaxis response regulator CheY